MHRTYCAVIGDPDADAILAPMGKVLGEVKRWAFREIHIRKRNPSKVKKEALAKFGITGRHFNGIKFDLDQEVNAWKGTVEYRIQSLKDAIEATEEKIESLGKGMAKARTEKRRKSLHFRQVGKKQRLDRLRGKLLVAEAELAAGKPKVCFGGRELLRQARHDPDAMRQWHDKRDGRIFLVGSKDEKEGNLSCRWDGQNLRVRLPDSLGGKTVTLTGITFRYGQKQMLRVLEMNKDKTTRVGLTWLLFRDEHGQWHVRVTVDEPPAKILTSTATGVIGVDLNVDHLAVVLVNHHGNPVSRLKLPFPDADMPEGKARAMVGDAVRALSLLALKTGFSIAIEKLDFGRKKAGLREFGKAHARRLSGFGYRKFYEILQSRCARDGVELIEVDPAYTSVIGRMRYARCRAMSAHHAAALVIGRAAQNRGERLVASDGTALDAPGRMRPRTERRRWRGARRLTREGARVPANTVRSVSGNKTTRGGCLRPASATAAQGPIPSRLGRARTRGGPPPAGGAVAPASETLSPQG